MKTIARPYNNLLLKYTQKLNDSAKPQAKTNNIFFTFKLLYLSYNTALNVLNIN